MDSRHGVMVDWLLILTFLTCMILDSSKDLIDYLARVPMTSYFPKHLFGPGMEVAFDQPATSTWTIIEKLSEKPNTLTEQDMQHDIGPPFCCARFLVVIMRVKKPI
jgi:hypothetical protein